ncbi:hypothetical protein PI124_g18724 [Phytophthora idaei]|nr:hypothetical protein PI125_g21219 [Phytophthora idaei]KAG3132531.1 hypothetical protein PI126_g19598 [Phytophthora idaei]KAG3236266.1 hypothetical protein PI124_g18724 [Phytophthora idaei]
MDTTAAAIVDVVSASVAVAIAITADKRSLASERENVSTFPTETLDRALKARYPRWFNKMLRCDRSFFLASTRAITAEWPVNCIIKAKFRIIHRVALNIMYLTQGGTIEAAGQVLNILHTRAVIYINLTLEMIVGIAKPTIRMASPSETSVVEDGFFTLAGFPDVVGAVDGTLVRIARPADFEGWYCRKDYPVVNVQAVVDYRGEFYSLSIRAGSTNDQSQWNG